MEPEIVNKVIELKEIYGERLLFDKKRLIAFIRDFFPGQIRDHNLLIRGMEIDLYKQLKELEPGTYELFEKRCIHKLYEEQLMDKKAAKECVRVWQMILEGRGASYKAPIVEKEMQKKEEDNTESIKPKKTISNDETLIAKRTSLKKYTFKDIKEICDKASFYYKGNPFVRNYEKAFKWYKRAAKLGHLDSMFQVGYMYENGKGVVKNPEKAMVWYKKAAELEHTGAMNNIGCLYEYGIGVKRDIETAISWYKRAADLGDRTAKNNIIKLKTTGNLR